MMATASETSSSTSARAKPYERMTAESEELLEQAAGFARGGDYLGAQARARFAEHCLVAIAASLPANDAWVVATHAHVDLRIRYYDSLVRQWQSEVGARRATYVARERRAIGAGEPPGLS
jgi:hypothetical protein